MSDSHAPFDTPEPIPAQHFGDAASAVERLCLIYRRNTMFLRARLASVLKDGGGVRRIRAYYPKLRVATQTHARLDSRLAFGFVPGPGVYETTVTRPDLFQRYLCEQIEHLMRNHAVEIEVGESQTPIPLHFALSDDFSLAYDAADKLDRPFRDIFDAPDLAVTDDAIVNGDFVPDASGIMPLAPFTAPRVDYSLHRLQHYTATAAAHFQNYVIFTNYQFYIDHFIALAKAHMNDPASPYEAFVEPGNVVTPRGARAAVSGEAPPRLPQMPAYHLKHSRQNGITMVNIGVGPSNAKTISDHVAVLRPHVWLMLGHCAGLRNTQKLGDYVLAHGYVREDHALDADVPLWVPIPALAEVQVALEQAVAEVTGFTGWELKKVMRTGTVATIDNRNWELRSHREVVERFSKSRAIALDMESATVAANGFRFRVPYGTLLCVSDKPLHGELKLPGMASEFYRRQINQHLMIGILAMEKLRAMPLEKLHSRKLRSFEEVAFQ